MDDRTLRENAIDFINYKRSLGYTYEGQEYVLNRYVTFAETRISSSIPVKCITEEFLSALADAPGTLYQAASVLREFSRYLLVRGFKEAYVLPPKMISQPTVENPYFFTEKEIDAFLKSLMRLNPILPSEGGK